MFCNMCKKIQPAIKTKDFFDLLSVPRTFNLDVSKLDKQFQNIQRKVHPDLYHRNSPVEREISADNASLINEAYKTLKDPNTRARYMLKLHGLDLDSEEKGSITDPDLLMEIMDKQEQIEETSSIPELKQLDEENNRQLDQLYQRVGQYLDQKQLEEASKELLRASYLLRMQTQLKEKLPAS